MSSETYEILALAARYWFLLLAGLIVIRGLANSRKENRRERNLREEIGSAGCVGELVVLEDGVKNKKKSLRGARFPVPEEGLIGSGRIADIRIRHADMNRKHVRFAYRPGELLIRPVGGADVDCPMKPDGTRALRDGERLIIGSLELLMVFYDLQDAAEAPDEPRRPRPAKKKEADEYEDPFEENFWE